MLVVATIGVLGALVTRTSSTETDIPTLDTLVVDLGQFKFIPIPKERESFDLASLPKDYDDRQVRLLRDNGLRRALSVKSRLPGGDRLLEVSIFEARGSSEARKLQREFDICLAISNTETFEVPGVADSTGTQCTDSEGRHFHGLLYQGSSALQIEAVGTFAASVQEADSGACPCRGGYRMIGTADQHLPGTETGAAALVRLTMSKFTK